MDPETQIRPYEPPAHSSLKLHEPAIYNAERMRDVPDLVEYWRVVQKRRATILTTLFVVFTVALFATLKEKRVYEARTLIEIQKENPDIPTLQELFQVESISDTYLETQNRILKSENLARRVITQLKLAQLPEFSSRESQGLALNPQQPDPQQSDAQSTSAAQVFAAAGSAPSQSDVPDDVLKKFQDRLSVEPVKRSRLIEVTFDSNDPKLAAQVVNTVASTYIQQNLEARWDTSQKASEWLSQQLEGMKAKLEKSEDDLQEYANKNGLLFLETDKGTTENIVTQRLRELQEQLTKAAGRQIRQGVVVPLARAGRLRIAAGRLRQQVDAGSFRARG